jgi:predicted histidine transporter YuiF (NhaC family)
MKSRLTALLVCLMFCAPFILVGLSYHALPPELPVLRLGVGHTVMSAPKSLFMAFRVPTMNLIHGLMAAIMLSHRTDFEYGARRISYSNIFSTLSFTIALKSDLEGLAFFAPTIPWIGPATLICVLIGLGGTLVAGLNVKFPWPELRLAMRDKIALCALLATYVAIVVASVAGAHPI